MNPNPTVIPNGPIWASAQQTVAEWQQSPMEAVIIQILFLVLILILLVKGLHLLRTQLHRLYKQREKAKNKIMGRIA